MSVSSIRPMFRETSNTADELSSETRSRGMNTRAGGAYVPELQRARICNAAVTLVAEIGYAQMSVDRVSRHAGVSRRTFYVCFTDFEDCFLAVFDAAGERIAGAIRAGCDG